MNNQESKLDETLAAAEQAAKQGKLTSSVRLVIVSLRQIVERQKRLVLKQQRMTLTVDCLKQTTGSGTSLFRVRFAKGIGIIEKSIYFSDDSKVQIDSTPPIEFIQIKEILQNS